MSFTDQAFQDRARDIKTMLDHAVLNQKAGTFSYALSESSAFIETYLSHGPEALMETELAKAVAFLDSLVEKQRAGASSFLFAHARDFLKELIEVKGNSSKKSDDAKNMLEGLGYVYENGQWVLPTQKENRGMLPCPFCGSSPVLTFDSDTRGVNYIVCCNNGDCPIDLCATAGQQSQEKAISSWNQRSLDLVVEVKENQVVVPKYVTFSRAIADFVVNFDFDDIGNNYHDAFDEFWPELLKRIENDLKSQKSDRG